MTFKTNIASDISSFFNDDEFAETITYAGSSITAVVSHEEKPAQESGSTVQKATLFVKVSDVATPAYRDAIVIGSDTWYMQGRLNGDGYVWELAIERDERPVL